MRRRASLHEGGHEGEGDGLGVEARQHDLAALGEPHHQTVDQFRIARRIVDRAVVAALVGRGVDDLVALGMAAPFRLGLPDHRRLAARGNGQTREQPAQGAVTHDQVRQHMVQPGQRMARGRGKRQKRPLGLERRIDAHRAVGGRHEPLRRRAEQAADRPRIGRRETVGARHEDPVARPEARIGRGLDHFARGLVARHQRVAHARKRRHLPGVEQFFGARRNARVGDLDDDIAGRGLVQLDGLKAKVPRTRQDDGGRSHSVFPRALPADLPCGTRVGLYRRFRCNINGTS